MPNSNACSVYLSRSERRLYVDWYCHVYHSAGDGLYEDPLYQMDFILLPIVLLRQYATNLDPNATALGSKVLAGFPEGSEFGRFGTAAQRSAGEGAYGALGSIEA